MKQWFKRELNSDIGDDTFLCEVEDDIILSQIERNGASWIYSGDRLSYFLCDGVPCFGDLCPSPFSKLREWENTGQETWTSISEEEYLTNWNKAKLLSKHKYLEN